MKQKKIPILIVALALIVVGIWFFDRPPAVPSIVLHPTATESNSAISGLFQQFSLERGGETFKGIKEQVQITGTNTTEFLVDLGSASASGDYMAIVLLKEGIFSKAEFKEKDGTLDSPIFRESEQCSGRCGAVIDLLPDQNVIYESNYSYFGKPDDSCTVNAYQWNSETGIFDWSASLSQQIQKSYCQAAKDKAESALD